MVKKKNTGLKYTIAIIAIGFVAFIVYQSVQASVEDPAKAALAQCLTQNGVAMYGVDTCPACVQQKGLFAQSFKYIEYVECDKSDGCTEANIASTPTWINAEDERLVGVQQLGALAEFGNCTARFEAALQE